MFDEITRPSIRVRAKRWYTIPVSIVSHSVALLAVIVIPLIATGELPTPKTVITLLTDFEPPPPPEPPPLVAPDVVPPSIEAPPVSGPPLEPPTGLSPEPPPVLRSVLKKMPETLPRASGRSLVAPPAPPAAPAGPVTVGGDIRTPTKLFGADPIFPAIAKAARMSGVVFLEAVLDREGRVRDLRVVRSAGVFDQAAIDAVSRWRYSPTMLNGEPVEVKMSVTVMFNLN